MAFEPEELEGVVRDIVAKVGNFVEEKMRAIYLAGRLNQLDEDDALQVMQTICERASQRIPEYIRAVMALVDIDTLTRIMGQKKVRRLYIESRKREYSELARILSNESPAKKYEGENEMFFQYGMTDKLLGHRKYLARKPDPVLIDKLSYDLDPLVVRDLLRNPMLTERQVVKIAARRPNKPEILEEIFNNPRWVARYQVKLALAHNPYTPPRIAVGLLVFLTEHDIMEIACDMSLHEDVRRQARAILKSRKIEVKQEDKPRRRGFQMYHIDLDKATIEPLEEAESEADEW